MARRRTGEHFTGSGGARQGRGSMEKRRHGSQIKAARAMAEETGPENSCRLLWRSSPVGGGPGPALPASPTLDPTQPEQSAAVDGEIKDFYCIREGKLGEESERELREQEEAAEEATEAAAWGGGEQGGWGGGEGGATKSAGVEIGRAHV